MGKVFGTECGRYSSFWAHVWVLAGVAACGADAEGRSVQVSVPTWTLSASPSVSIGREDGDPRYQLFRVMDAELLDDGRIVVANAGNNSLSVYDARGTYVRSIGRKGEGPGEFEVPMWVGSVAGDTVLVWDRRLKRISIFGPSGDLARVTTLEGADGAFPEAVGLLGDRSFVTNAGVDVFGMASRRGVVRDSITLQRFGPDGKLTGVVGTFPGDESYINERDRGYTWDALPFGRQTFTVAGRNGVYVADGETGRVTLYGLDGQRIQSWNSPLEGWNVSPQDIENFKQERLAQIVVEERRRETQAMLDGAPFPKVSPVIGALKVDLEGNVWVQSFPRPGAETARWVIMAPSGQPVGQIEIPTRAEVFKVGRDYVLGRWRDEMDVEQIRLYGVSKS
jgi:hypothetical protein